MFWIVLAILIIVGWLIYSKRKGSITLTKDQAEMVGGLVRKEKTELEKKMQDMVDESALQGKTITVDSLCKETADMSEDVKKGLLTFKQGLLDKYGPIIPVNTAHRISWEIEGNGKMWNDSPGCFERHLQKREGNPLFLPERRIITRKEIEEARDKDELDQEIFNKKVSEMASQMRNLGKISIAQVSTLLQNIQTLMEEAASIGGEALNKISNLENIENNLMQQLISATPEVKETLEKFKSLSVMERNPYMAQMKRKDTPILKEEEIPTLLSEDLETISFAGYASRAFAPNYRPNEADIKTHLDVAIGQGFSKDRAREIMAAWNQNQ